MAKIKPCVLIPRISPDRGNAEYILHEGETLADAIRNAGIRCETCEHFRKPDICVGDTCGSFSGWEYSGAVTADFFCANHSELR